MPRASTSEQEALTSSEAISLDEIWSKANTVLNTIKISAPNFSKPMSGLDWLTVANIVPAPNPAHGDPHPTNDSQWCSGCSCYVPTTEFHKHPVEEDIPSVPKKNYLFEVKKQQAKQKKKARQKAAKKKVTVSADLKYDWMLDNNSNKKGPHGSGGYRSNGYVRPLVFPLRNTGTALVRHSPTRPKDGRIGLSIAHLAATFYVTEAILAGALTAPNLSPSEAQSRAKNVYDEIPLHVPYYAMKASQAIGGELRHHASIAGRELPITSRPSAWKHWMKIMALYGPDALQAAERLFCEFDGGGYGGPKWANSTALVYQYYTGELNAYQFVDRVTNLYHNGGNLLDKLAFMHASSLPVIADAHAQAPPDYKRLCGFMGSSIQQYLGFNPSEPTSISFARNRRDLLNFAGLCGEPRSPLSRWFQDFLQSYGRSYPDLKSNAGWAIRVDNTFNARSSYKSGIHDDWVCTNAKCEMNVSLRPVQIDIYYPGRSSISNTLRELYRKRLNKFGSTAIVLDEAYVVRIEDHEGEHPPQETTSGQVEPQF